MKRKKNSDKQANIHWHRLLCWWDTSALHFGHSLRHNGLVTVLWFLDLHPSHSVRWALLLDLSRRFLLPIWCYHRFVPFWCANVCCVFSSCLFWKCVRCDYFDLTDTTGFCANPVKKQTQFQLLYDQIISQVFMLAQSKWCTCYQIANGIFFSPPPPSFFMCDVSSDTIYTYNGLFLSYICL